MCSDTTQNVFPSLQSSDVWRVAKTYAACLYLMTLDGEKIHKNPSGCSFFMLFTVLMILQICAVSTLLSISLQTKEL